MYIPLQFKIKMFAKNHLKKPDVFVPLVFFIFFIYFFRIFDAPLMAIDIKTYHVKFIKTTSGFKTQIRDHVLDKKTEKTLNLISNYSFDSLSKDDQNNLIIQVVKYPAHRYTEDLYLMKLMVNDNLNFLITLDELNSEFFYRRLFKFLFLLLIPFTAIFHSYIKNSPKASS